MCSKFWEGNNFFKNEWEVSESKSVKRSSSVHSLEKSEDSLIVLKFRKSEEMQWGPFDIYSSFNLEKTKK